MAAVAPRARDQPDIRAHISTSGESPNDLKLQLELADRTQRALRQSQPWHSNLSQYDIAGNLARAHAALLRKAGTLAHRPSPTDSLGCEVTPRSLRKSYSFTSLSTTQQEADAANLACYRDSPVSAASPPPSGSLSRFDDHQPKLEDPCPPLSVYTIKQARRDQKILRKSMKKKEKRERKAQKAAEHKWRVISAAELAMARRSSTPSADSPPSSLPRVSSAKSWSSSQTSKDVATQLVKGLTLKSPLSNLVHRVKRDKSAVPSLDDFPSKPALREYLNPNRVEASVIAELPANLPPYTPFEDSTRTEDNEPVGPPEDAPKQEPMPECAPCKKDSPVLPMPSGSMKAMRCDFCQSPIKQNEVYYHCSICEDGDRMLCTACDAAGRSCRHPLTEKVRNVVRAHVQPERPDAATSTKTAAQLDPPHHHAATLLGVVLPPSAPETFPRAETAGQCHGCAGMASLPHRMSVVDHTTAKGHDRRDGQSYETTEARNETQGLLELRSREKDVLFREKELALRERELAIREQQAVLREREAMLSERERVLAQQQVQSNLLQRKDLAVGVGAQFQAPETSVPISSTTEAEFPVSRSVSLTSQPHSDSPQSQTRDGGADDDADDDSIDYLSKARHVIEALSEILYQEPHVRSRTTKRKAGAQSGSGSWSASPGSHFNFIPHGTSAGGRAPNDEEEDESGSGSTPPKKPKHDPESLALPDKLFACHFCKHNNSRYSEQNLREKQYRGCSSGYWPDISRLKQHLYRVHWRRHHCSRCYAKFDSKQSLDRHSQHACTAQECPYPEKFGDDKYNEIRRKRPTNSPEEVWYTIYSILFPGSPPPSSPYVDNVNLPSPSAASPSVPVSPDNLGVLGELFESRLNQHQQEPQQAWLRDPGARDFLRQQLKESMAELLRRIPGVDSPSAEHAFLDVSPHSTVAPDSARRSSVSQTPISSVPPSPATGSTNATGSFSDAQWLLRSHRHSFSRPFPARYARRKVEAAVESEMAHAPHLPPANNSMSGLVFPDIGCHDPANDRDDEVDDEDDDKDETTSWKAGDEALGLALTTSNFVFDFEPELQSSQASVVEDGCPEPHPSLLPSSQLPPTTSNKFTPVKLVSVADDPLPRKSVPTNLKQNLSSASIDSGYGSLGSRPSHSTPRAKAKASVVDHDEPVPESAINYNALDVPYEQFLGTDTDDFGNVDGNTLADYLDNTYPTNRGCWEGGEDLPRVGWQQT